MIRKCSPIVVSALCAVLLLASVSCWAGWSYKQTALPGLNGRVSDPKLSGNSAVALFKMKSGTAYVTTGVISYDLAGKQVYTIHKGKAVTPCISGSTAAFSGMINDIPALRGTAGKRGTWPQSLILYDLSSGVSTAPVLKTNSAFVDSISGTLVAYELGCRIYLFNTATGAQQRISDDQALNRCPDICGDLVVWLQYEDRTMKNARVLCHRLSTGQTTACSDVYTACSWPKTDGATIVWATGAGTTVYDAKKGFVRLIPGAHYPDVSNGVVIYGKGTACLCGCSTSGVPLYGGAVGSAGEFKIGDVNTDTIPSIDNRRVVWARSGVLYFADLEEVTSTRSSPSPIRKPLPYPDKKVN